jgi:hypothetical protein
MQSQHPRLQQLRLFSRPLRNPIATPRASWSLCANGSSFASCPRHLHQETSFSTSSRAYAQSKSPKTPYEAARARQAEKNRAFLMYGTATVCLLPPSVRNLSDYRVDLTRNRCDLCRCAAIPSVLRCHWIRGHTEDRNGEILCRETATSNRRSQNKGHLQFCHLRGPALEFRPATEACLRPSRGNLTGILHSEEQCSM